jgi:hypothetical protein
MNDHITKDGRTFWWLANIPYERKDKTHTEIAVWHSPCVVCGAPFTVSTPTSGVSESFGRKHCDEHKLTPAEVTKRWRAAIVQNKAG